MQFREKEGIPANAILKDVPPDEPCVLVREPTNKYDPNAIQVWVRGAHVGYIPKTQNAVLARFIDANAKPCVLPTQDTTAYSDEYARDANITTKQGVAARVHKGNNPVPLVEIV